ncbi:MAG: hypothetical protein JWO38_6813 [Gemmataceae bacterium]|nr:hypothetical protein [Gemmataceae bacterium]
MPHDTTFRLSTYLTLAAACACLGYSESYLLPEVAVFAAAIVVALAVIYRLETRVRLLSISDANKLGAGIALGGFLWAVYRIVRELRTGEFAAIGWPLFAIAMTGPVLMAAIAAKMLRKEKHAGDYWVLHGCGLGAIVLAGAMSERPASFVLMVVYAACGVWALSRFNLARANGSVPPIPDRGPAAPRAGAVRAVETVPPAGLSGFTGAFLLTVAAGALAVPVYLLTPRSSFGKLDFNPQRIEIGYAADQMIDLNRTGDLTENPETAFEVVAEEADGRPKEDLSPTQLWRGTVFTHYLNGSWRRDTQIQFPNPSSTARRAGPWFPPDLGPGRYRLTFSVPGKLRGLFLADPVAWKAGEPPPVADLVPDGPQQAWYSRPDGSFIRLTGMKSGSDLQYVQYTCPPPEPGFGPAFTLAGDMDRVLVTNPVRAVKEYADSVLVQAVRGKRLPAAALTRDVVWQRPPEDLSEAIARTFRDHLADRAGLTYSTTVRRERTEVDPVEDFLLYSKTGHCERFATALVLMLRSQGIPAVMVLGFKGCEHVGDGRYVVRQEHAHAWVEALISRPALPTGTPARRADQAPPRIRHWVSLDPGPAAQTSGPAAEGSKDGVAAWSRTTFDRYVLRYTPEQRARALRAAADALTSPWLFAGVGAVVVLGLVARAVGRPARSVPQALPDSARWFDRLVTVLGAHGYSPAPGDTPQEFAAAAAAALRLRPPTANVAEVPVWWAEAYYQSRFGGVPIPDDRRAELEVGLDGLRRALKSDRGGGL